MKAKKTTVKFGGTYEIEAVLTDDDSLYVTARSVASLFQIPQNNIHRDLKAILGDVSRFLKFQLESDGANRDFNTCIALSDFERVLRHFDRKGNETAIAITDSMVGLSLTQLFYDQFGIEFGKENRKQWLEARNKGKTTRRTLTDAIMDYIEVNQIPSDKAKWVYSNASDALNKGLFGLTAKRLREFYGCKPHELRDCFDKKELHAIESVEYVAVNLVDSGMEPTEAVKETLARTLMAGKFSQKYLSA